jgi:hypothetical protein
MRSCEIAIFDAHTGKEAFSILLYGIGVREMLTVPPPVSVKTVLEKRGFDTTRFVSSIFCVGPIKRWE